MIFNYNGNINDADTLPVSLSNRALLYGDGVFETIKYAHGKLLFWEDHYFRLMASMRILRIRIPEHWTPEFLQSEILELISAHHWEKQAVRVRLTVWRSGGGLYTPELHAPEYLITCTQLEAHEYSFPSQTIRVDVYKDVPKPTNLLSGLKLIGSQLYVLASIFAAENELYDALLINDAKNIVEAARSNIFALFGRQLITPPLRSGALRGIMRQRILKAANKADLSVEEKDLTPFDLLKADELWLTNVIQGITPVTNYRTKTYTSEQAQIMIGVLNEIAHQDTFDLAF
ncbi:aminotransferase class IV [Thermaurantimonas aggregans]|uniref:branched-chain-amino-acid transaminase n=1 Tax=Thermaurantimonas aggregans TaxID=2173829 RepID=A0A401XLJ7_9FLAO|nr:aminotransferase class IV [Thermaurantimonas aggregans]MCX8149121.1 aminotransferase class IV [Thermaurantimonas aggregans]GCD77905.1 aminotransferase class IV [Thermaurantimonas aggregans]